MMYRLNGHGQAFQKRKKNVPIVAATVYECPVCGVTQNMTRKRLAIAMAYSTEGPPLSSGIRPEFWAQYDVTARIANRYGADSL